MENANQDKDNLGLKGAYRAAYLVAGFIRGTLTMIEKRELDDWIKASDDNMRLFDELTDEKNVKQSLEWFETLDTEAALAQTKRRAGIRRKRSAILTYAIAATVIGIIALIYFLRPAGNKFSSGVATQATDISPASGFAYLTVADGSIIPIGTRDTSIDGRITITKDKAEIMYTEQTNPAATLVYHTLTVPRKGHYKVLLPDGTIAWLNSESSIRYPVAFGSEERRVYVTGETYFEVAKDKAKPFRVVAGEVTIEALGTKFDVNAYSNEPHVAATLAEGSILVAHGTEENILKPGQQAQLQQGKFTIVDADLGEILAWKNDQFIFKNTPLDVIMRQIERWYDAEVVYEDQVILHVNVTIERDVPASRLLHILSETDQVHFKVDGKKITVSK